MDRHRTMCLQAWGNLETKIPVRFVWEEKNADDTKDTN